EYLPPVSTTGLLRKVRAAIYLSMDELWTAPTDIALVAAFLDPRFKHFNWTTTVEQNKAQKLVEDLYDELRVNLSIPDDIEEGLVDKSYKDDDGNFFRRLEADFTQNDVREESEKYTLVMSTIAEIGFALK
ncbi:31288_t:CDS:2, partial [Racocetra persica]